MISEFAFSQTFVKAVNVHSSAAFQKIVENDLVAHQFSKDG